MRMEESLRGRGKENELGPRTFAGGKRREKKKNPLRLMVPETSTKMIGEGEGGGGRGGEDKNVDSMDCVLIGWTEAGGRREGGKRKEKRGEREGEGGRERRRGEGKKWDREREGGGYEGGDGRGRGKEREEEGRGRRREREGSGFAPSGTAASKRKEGEPQVAFFSLTPAWGRAPERKGG